MTVLEIPNKLKVLIAGGKITYSTTDYVEMVKGAFNRNGHPDVTEADVKRQIWCVLNDKPTDFVGDYLKKHIVLEGK